MKWISVNDQSPEKGSSVLCIDKNGRMFVAQYFDDCKILRWRFDSGHCCDYELDDAVFWMPLPPPPEET